ncbi:protein TIFY 4B-like isoform X2 [Corylus avellana]|uniref:protein TIFY 4B-like isoform X2 n=1 Tax=Corylus avellana TaxID=13451 RepID=UPI00286A8D44|nr:protein TIFY 4B-like isoform X2 [Corylus avellana]
MNAATTSFRSILDKPLSQLTEEDISQLTREDCRKYLKDKGMRRPSWNKSQAIQQVISLKALLEPSDDDSGAGALRRAVVSQPRMTSNSVDSVKEPSPDVQVSVSVSAEEKRDTPISAPSGDRPAEIENNAISPRSPCATNGSVGQMTIFYCGKVNVYDGVPPEKARAIMHLAASPVQLPQDDTLGRAASLWSVPCHLQAACEKDRVIPTSPAIAHIMQAEKMTEYSEQYREKGNTSRDPEGQANRKVSLQRYLEKRKDRGRLKSKKSTGLITSSLETYLNHQVRTHTPNGKSSRSNTSSPPQHGLPQAMSSSVDNQLKSAGLAVDLNDKDVQEC